VTKINHQTFVIPGVVDYAVAMLQAERRRDKDNETTIVHVHRSGEACIEKCRVVEPGFKTRAVGATPEPEVEEEQY
jgi:hypothetical protein